VFLKTLVGLPKPQRGSVKVAGRDNTRLREHDLYEVRKLFGALFQDGALFGSMNHYDNIAFPLREHTRNGRSWKRASCGPTHARPESWSSPTAR
jgi:ABC-type transport system involved in resistance to organic solvents, ATPase component